MADKVRIVHVIPQDGVGGVEVAARAMAGERDPAYEFRLVLIAGCAMVPAPSIVESRRIGRNDPRAHFAAVRTILGLAPDVLICSLWRSVPACLTVKLWRPRTALVMFLHLDRPVHLLDRILTRLGLMAADEVWSDSAATLAARGAPRGKPTKILSFVLARLAPARPISPPAAHFVCWARIAAQKGIDRAILLVRALVDRGIDARFAIWGPDGGEQVALTRKVAELGLERHVAFRGVAPRSSLSAIALDNSFFLQLSRFEGMAMSVVEGMQLGLVPVTTDAGQMAQYVQHGTTGIKVDPARLDAAADAIRALLADPARFDAIRARAQALWARTPLYADDVRSYARALAARRGA